MANQKNILQKDDLGYFDVDNKEYVITNMYPKRPLINLLWNNTTLSQIDHFGCGKTFVWDGKLRRFFESGNRVVYIKDLLSGEIYSPNRNFKMLPFDEFISHVGNGYSTIESLYKGLKVKFTIIVPVNDVVISYKISITNTSNEARKLSCYFVDELFTNLTDHDAAGKGCKDIKYGGLYFPHDNYDDEHFTEYTHVYVASSKQYTSYAVTLRDVLGTYGSFDNPIGIKEDELPSKDSIFESKYTASLQYKIDLKPGEQIEYYVAVSCGSDFDLTAKTALKYASNIEFLTSYASCSMFEADMYDKFVANIPDKYMENMVNVWLKHQVAFGKSWGRIYHKGFRDVLQDATSFASFAPETAKKRILITLSYQFKNGNCVRGYDPVTVLGNNDGASWIPEAVSSYLKETGDIRFLDLMVNYYNGGEDTVFNHMLKGLDYLTNDTGKRGLILFRRSDWNDSTNGAGNLGIGESVWLSIATVRALKIFAEICDLVGKQHIKVIMLEKSSILADNILKFGFINDRFIHGYDDWDNIIGYGDDEEEGSFYLNSQTWAVLSGIGDLKIQRKIMDKVEERLKTPFGYVLIDPPYTHPTKGIGRTSYFTPGAVENGSVHIHTNMFKALADCMIGRGDKAYETICDVLYPNNINSGVEPYAISTMFIGPSNKERCGDAPLSWITGSAGWMYRAITEYLLGVQADYKGLKIHPTPPKAWTEFSVKRLYRNVVYNISFKKTGKFQIYINNVAIEGDIIPFYTAGTKCNVLVEF